MSTHSRITLLIVSTVCSTLVMCWLKSASGFSSCFKVSSLDFSLGTHACGELLTRAIFKESFPFFSTRNIVDNYQENYCFTTSAESSLDSVFSWDFSWSSANSISSLTVDEKCEVACTRASEESPFESIEFGILLTAGLLPSKLWHKP